MHQKPSSADGIMIKAVSEAVRGNVKSENIQFPVFDPCKGIQKLDRTHSATFYFSSAQFNARFHGFKDFIIMESLAISGDNAFIAVLFVFFLGHLSSLQGEDSIMSEGIFLPFW